MKVELLAYTPNAERVIASSAKLCYSKVGVEELMKKQTDENVETFLNHLMSIGHESPIEHVSFTFAIEGVSRVLTHQLVRHRLASYSQQSQRYVKLNQFEYIVPEAIENNENAKKIYKEAMELSQEAYDTLVTILSHEMYKDYFKNNDILIKHVSSYTHKNLANILYHYDKKEYSKIEKKAIENARYVFPNACETKIVVTMNARTLMNFFSHRCCNRAQDEIRALANEMLEKVKEVAPTLFKYAGAPCVKGNCPEGNMSCGRPIKVD